MGDFNDAPFAPSPTQHVLSSRQRKKVRNSTAARRLFDLMRPLLGTDDQPGPHPRPSGTFSFENQANVLDQFRVNENMLATSAPLRAEPGSVPIVTGPPAMVGTGRVPRTRPLRRHGSRRPTRAAAAATVPSPCTSAQPTESEPVPQIHLRTLRGGPERHARLGVVPLMRTGFVTVGTSRLSRCPELGATACEVRGWRVAPARIGD